MTTERRMLPGSEDFEAGFGWHDKSMYVSYQAGITALPGGGQSGAPKLTMMINRVTTVATALDSTQLPMARGGRQVMVTNAASNTLAIFPSPGDAINLSSANSPFKLTGNTSVAFYSALDGQWDTILAEQITEIITGQAMSISAKLAGSAALRAAPVIVPA